MSHRRRRKGGNESRNMLLHCWGRARHWTPLLRARPTKQQSPCELFYGICLSVRPLVCLSVPSFRQSRHRHTMRISFSHFVFLQAKLSNKVNRNGCVFLVQPTNQNKCIIPQGCLSRRKGKTKLKLRAEMRRRPRQPWTDYIFDPRQNYTKRQPAPRKEKILTDLCHL